MVQTASRTWLESRRADWARIDRSLRQSERRVDSEIEAMRQVDDYRVLAHDVAVARQLLPDSDIVLRLEQWLRSLHVRLHRHELPWREQIKRLYFIDIPNQVRKIRPALWVVLAIMCLAGVIAAALVSAYPELISLIVSERLIATVEQGQLWTDKLLDITPSSLLTTHIAQHNITLALITFMMGAFYGVGTVYFVSINGAMLGATLAFTAQHHLMFRLLRFIVAHGVIELSVIILASAAGAELGEAIARPGMRTRTQALSEAVRENGKLLFVVVPFLMLAGTIEGFVSPTDLFDLPTRLLIGLLAGYLLWAVLTGAAWKRWTSRPPESFD